jgi:hypothetical protein
MGCSGQCAGTGRPWFEPAFWSDCWWLRSVIRPGAMALQSSWAATIAPRSASPMACGPGRGARRAECFAAGQAHRVCPGRS